MTRVRTRLQLATISHPVWWWRPSVRENWHIALYSALQLVATSQPKTWNSNNRNSNNNNAPLLQAPQPRPQQPGNMLSKQALLHTFAPVAVELLGPLAMRPVNFWLIWYSACHWSPAIPVKRPSPTYFSGFQFSSSKCSGISGLIYRGRWWC